VVRICRVRVSTRRVFSISKLMGFGESVADAAGPATRRRLSVTETDELTEALDEAARRCPNERRPHLLLTW
jgi:hypothetical protein